MSPAAVIGASSGGAHAVEAGPDERVFELDLRATAAYRAGALTFEAQFFFTQGSRRLAAVKLVPTSISLCDAVRAELESTYGAPSEAVLSIGRTYSWVDAEHNNRVMFADIDPIGRFAGLCHVIYRPIRMQASGL